jgi:type IX secretion system PorP/SprF family membrane protein
MKKIFLSTVFAALVLSTSAQQLPLYSQYAFNPFLYNPAMTGVSGETNAFLIHRSQWAGISGGPVTNAFTIDGFLEERNTGLGLNIFNDVQDINERLGIYASYAYRLKINDDMHARFGLSLGFLDNRLDFSKAVVSDNNDPMLFGQIQRKSALDATVGGMFAWKDLRVGISVPQLLGQQVKYQTYDTRSFYELNRHYMGSVGYRWLFNETNQLTLEPTALVRWVPGAPFQYDVNAQVNWKDFAWLGVSYRSNYAVGANARIRLWNSLSAGYAYDFIITPLRTSAGISHEFMLGYTFGKVQAATTSGGHVRGKYD